jgi:hypothetical protein
VKKFKYRVFNLSELMAMNKGITQGKGKTWLDVFNDLGEEGWEFVQKWNDSSFLFKREVIVGSP